MQLLHPALTVKFGRQFFSQAMQHIPLTAKRHGSAEAAGLKAMIGSPEASEGRPLSDGTDERPWWRNPASALPKAATPCLHGRPPIEIIRWRPMTPLSGAKII